MNTLYLVLAILLEAGWAICMKLSNGFAHRGYSAATAVMYILSLVFLTLATRKMDIGVGYAIWAGCGVALIALYGITALREPVTLVKVGSLALIIVGIVGLSLSRGGH